MRRDVPVPTHFGGWGESFGAVAPDYDALAFARGSTDVLGERELDAMHAGLRAVTTGRTDALRAGEPIVVYTERSTPVAGDKLYVDALARVTPTSRPPEAPGGVATMPAGRPSRSTPETPGER